MTDDIELIHSPLTQTLSGEGHTLRIEIYRGPDEPWILEIVDELGTSSVWDAVFESDQAALEAALSAIEEEGGIHNFVLDAQRGAKEAQPELMRRLAALQPQALPVDAQLMLQPLSDDELEELEQILLYDIESEESMTLEMLDGFLHALAIGPETVPPSRWLPKVWGQDRDMTPPLASVEQLNRLLGLVTRYFNSIVSDFEQSPPEPRPVWRTRVTDMGEFEDAETWAYGFFEGVQLSRAAWQPLLNSPEGRRWYRPIGLLGEDRFSADQDELTLTSQQRHALAAEIEDSLLRIHSFWLPLRQAVAERQLAQRMSDKVGRNDPCPCGSGKKFKKCCGAPSDLH